MNHALTAEEIEFCKLAGLVVGLDDDDEDKHQRAHICWPAQSGAGTLCASPRLWFRGGEPEVIDCPVCVQLLRRLQVDPCDPLRNDLLRTIGRLARRTELLSEVSHAASDMLELIDHPEKYVGKNWTAVPAARERLDVALRFEHEDFVANCAKAT